MALRLTLASLRAPTHALRSRTYLQGYFISRGASNASGDASGNGQADKEQSITENDSTQDADIKRLEALKRFGLPKDTELLGNRPREVTKTSEPEDKKDEARPLTDEVSLRTFDCGTAYDLPTKGNGSIETCVSPHTLANHRIIRRFGPTMWSICRIKGTKVSDLVLSKLPFLVLKVAMPL